MNSVTDDSVMVVLGSWFESIETHTYIYKKVNLSNL